MDMQTNSKRPCSYIGFRVYIGGYIGIMEKKMEAAGISYRVYIGIIGSYIQKGRNPFGP